MAKTIKQLADELNVSKQTVQYHYQRLPAKNRQRSSKDQQRDNKDHHDLIAVLTREIADLKTERDQQIASKDQQIKTLTKLLDQS